MTVINGQSKIPGLIPWHNPRPQSPFRVREVGGAAVGAVIGGSEGAKKGAAAGALVGCMRRRNQVREETYSQDQWEKDQATAFKIKRDEYNRAYGACLEGKGYTVK